MSTLKQRIIAEMRRCHIDATADPVYGYDDPAVAAWGVDNALSDSKTLAEIFDKALSGIVELMDWRESVLGTHDPSTALPVDPSARDRWISTATANGWTEDHIYEWDGSAWIDFGPNDGCTVWNEQNDEHWTYYAAAWHVTPSSSTHTHVATDVTSGTFADARVAQSNVTQHQGALSIGWSQLTGLPAYATRWPSWTEVTGKPSTFDPSAHASSHGDGGSDEIAIDWSQITTGVPSSFTPSAHTHAAGDITSGTFADARVAQSNVTQHQGALSIGWSQLTGLPAYATRWPSWSEVTGKPTTFEPTAHASSHESGGSDALSFSAITGFGTYIDQGVRTSDSPEFVNIVVGSGVKADDDSSALLLHGANSGNTYGPALEMYGRDHATLAGRAHLTFGGYDGTGSFYVRHRTTSGFALAFVINSDLNATFYGDLAVTGDVTGNNLNVSDWDTAYGWGDHAGLYADVSHATEHESGGADEIDHDLLYNYNMYEHANHTSVSITAGNGLTGGGSIWQSRTLHVGAGTGISVGADSVSFNTGWGDARYVTTEADPVVGAVDGIVKADGLGNISAAIPSSTVVVGDYYRAVAGIKISDGFGTGDPGISIDDGLGGLAVFLAGSTMNSYFGNALFVGASSIGSGNTFGVSGKSAFTDDVDMWEGLKVQGVVEMTQISVTSTLNEVITIDSVTGQLYRRTIDGGVWGGGTYTPSAHASSHESGGSDALSFSAIAGFGTYLDQGVRTSDTPSFAGGTFTSTVSTEQIDCNTNLVFRTQTGNGLMYEDSGGGGRRALTFDADTVILSNRAANGNVEIRANDASAGSGGEHTVLTAEYNKVTVTPQLVLEHEWIAMNGTGDTIGLRMVGSATGHDDWRFYSSDGVVGGWGPANSLVIRNVTNSNLVAYWTNDLFRATTQVSCTGLKLDNKEQSTFTAESGALYFDENYYDDFSFLNGDGGGLSIYHDSAWRVILDSQNMAFLSSTFYDVDSKKEILFGEYVAPRSSRDSYDTYRLFTTNGNYAIGMRSSQTYGYLNDWATVFSMYDTGSDRGWLWRESNSGNGVMSLTTAGELKVKTLVDVPNIKVTDYDSSDDFYAEGSFTATLTPNNSGSYYQGIAYWRRVGAVVTVEMPSLYAQDTTALYGPFEINGIPSAIRPTRSQSVYCSVFFSNDGFVTDDRRFGRIRILASSSTWSIYYMNDAGNWSGNGYQYGGVESFTFSYNLD